MSTATTAKTDTEQDREPKGPTRVQIAAAQALLRRTEFGYGKDTPEIRRIANAKPVD